MDELCIIDAPHYKMLKIVYCYINFAKCSPHPYPGGICWFWSCRYQRKARPNLFYGLWILMQGNWYEWQTFFFICKNFLVFGLLCWKKHTGGTVFFLCQSVKCERTGIFFFYLGHTKCQLWSMDFPLQKSMRAGNFFYKYKQNFGQWIFSRIIRYGRKLFFTFFPLV